MKLFTIKFFDRTDWDEKELKIIANSKEELMIFLKNKYFSLSDKGMKLADGSLRKAKYSVYHRRIDVMLDFWAACIYKLTSEVMMKNEKGTVNPNDLPKFEIACTNYHVSSRWDYFKSHYVDGDEESGYKLDMNPDYQRDHVWTLEQRIKYIEFVFKGGQSGTNVYLNHPNWMGSFEGTLELVDGKQRITSVIMFLNNEFPIFNNVYYKDLTHLPSNCEFEVHINNLKSREEVIKWYLQMNDGGTVHTKEEIERVKNLLNNEEKELQ